MTQFIDSIFIDWEHYFGAIRVTLSVFVVCLVISILVTIFSWKIHNFKIVKFTTLLVAILAISVLGALIGFSGGNSRTGVVGDLMPAVLTFMAGAAVYLFGISDRTPRPEMYPIVVGFTFALFFNFALGASNRVGFEAPRFIRDTCIEIFSNADLLSSDQAVANATLLFGRRCGAHVDIQITQTGDDLNGAVSGAPASK